LQHQLESQFEYRVRAIEKMKVVIPVTPGKMSRKSAALTTVRPP